MSYRVRIKRSAAKALAAMARADRLRPIDAIDRLADNPAAGCALKGGPSGLRHVRVGSYRIVHEV